MLHARPQQTEFSVRHFQFLLTACSRSLVLLLVFAAPATWACDDWLAKTVAITGAVERKSTADWQQLQVEQTICPGDSVRVGPNSRAALYLRNNSFVRLDENSLLDFPAQQQENGFLLGLSQGFAHFISRIVNRFEVSTPYVNAVVEGTEFIVSATAATAGVAVMEGKVKTYNDAGTELITSGQQVQATSRTASLTRINVPSASRVEWAIHYPPVLTLQNIQPVSAEEKARLDALTPFLQQNRPDLALQSLEQNPAASPALDLARASLLLAVGRSDEFDALIPALLQGPQAGTAHALKAVADAARNRAEPALASAHKAVELAPQQAASHIALSYAQQASLQLDDALASAKKATDVEPSDALAWLRLVELRLTQGDIGAAKKALEQIDKLPPEKQQPQVGILSAKGFVNLFSLKLKAAQDNFQAALKQDSADPQNHLGLGLALLRDGKLEDGRRQLEYAVSLDPLRSILRSYLGRAYFEEKREGEAIKQWDLAKQFDPNDPTPYFYTGVHKLFANDPIGAVDELEKSKELNDKRDIYRSETLLQSDAASRSATLARAYDEVGYDQGVLLNGWDAIRRDPTNSEGHRLLADKYAGNSRYESARASELLQSQLWQPLSAYPLQPQLSEANIVVVEGNGPQRPSFNEYHSLFTEDSVYGMANGYLGSDNTWGDDLVGSFLAGPVALSLGQYHYESDGWRENADQQQDIYSGLVQWQVVPGTSLQAEVRQFEWERGDLAVPLVGGADESYRSDLERDSYRFGIRHELDVTSAILVSASRQNVSELQKFEPQLGTSLVVESESDPQTLELQYVSHGSYGQLVAGVGGQQSDELLDTVGSEQDFVYFLQTDKLDYDVFSGYVYYGSPAIRDFSVNLGVDFDRYSDDRVSRIELFGEPVLEQHESERDQWSPKLGVAWKMNEDLLLRLAAFRTYKKSLVGSATLQPTQVMGFNQLYDDPNGADAKNYAFALDGKFGKANYGFGVLNHRYDYRRVGGGDDPLYPKEFMQNFYLNSALTSRLVLGWELSHFDTDFDILDNEVDSYRTMDSIRSPLFAHYFLSSHWSLYAQSTYYNQKVEWSVEDLDTFSIVESERQDILWVSDFEARYQLPRRHGLLRAGVQNIEDKNVGLVLPNTQFLQYYPGRFLFFAFSVVL